MLDDKALLIAEIKGLLNHLELRVNNVRFNLAHDNLYALTEEMNTMRYLLDHVEQKINHAKHNKNEDDEYI